MHLADIADRRLQRRERGAARAGGVARDRRRAPRCTSTPRASSSTTRRCASTRRRARRWPRWSTATRCGRCWRRCGGCSRSTPINTVALRRRLADGGRARGLSVRVGRWAGSGRWQSAGRGRCRGSGRRWHPAVPACRSACARRAASCRRVRSKPPDDRRTTSTKIAAERAAKDAAFTAGDDPDPEGAARRVPAARLLSDRSRTTTCRRALKPIDDTTIDRDADVDRRNRARCGASARSSSRSRASR